MNNTSTEYHTESQPLAVLRLGTMPYQEVWELQRRLQRDLINCLSSGTPSQETLIVCEHPPTITLGRSAKADNVLLPPDELLRRGVAVFEVERGGDVTYHGPGQVVLYPIINLALRRRDVGWYMRSLEQIIIDTLQPLGITGLQVNGRTGVWTHSSHTDIKINGLGQSRIPSAKIASIGVRISRWCTLHGLALNVADNRSGFNLINPCGYRDIQITSVEQELGRAVPASEVLAIRDSLVERFIATFSAVNKSVSF